MGEEANGTYRCSHCANELKPGQMVCDYCGQEREGYEHATETSESYTHTSSEKTESDFGAEYSDMDDKVGALLPYIGKNREYYGGKFRTIKTTDKKNSWNLCAFLFSSFWLVYRKMYVPAVVIAIVYTYTESILLNLALSILVGIFGNYIYMQRIERLVVKEKTLASGQDREKYIQKNAGTSVIAVFVLLLFLVLI